MISCVFTDGLPCARTRAATPRTRTRAHIHSTRWFGTNTHIIIINIIAVHVLVQMCVYRQHARHALANVHTHTHVHVQSTQSILGRATAHSKMGTANYSSTVRQGRTHTRIHVRFDLCGEHFSTKRDDDDDDGEDGCVLILIASKISIVAV